MTPEDGIWTLWKPEEIIGSNFSDTLIDLTLAADGTIWIVDHSGNLCQFDPEFITCQQFLSPPDKTGSPTALAVNSQGMGGCREAEQVVFKFIRRGNGNPFKRCTRRRTTPIRR